MLIAQLLEIGSWFLPLNKKRIVFNSTKNSNYNFNSRYLFEACLIELKDVEVLFVINDDKLRKKLTKEIGNYFINTNSISGLVKVSRAKLWISSVLETPYLPLFFLINRKRIIYHIGHGVPLKNIGLSEENLSFLKFLNRYLRTRIFTHAMSYSKEFQPKIETIFKKSKIIYTHFGQPRNDSLGRLNLEEIFLKINKKYPQVNSKSKLILYAPTWRNYTTTKFFPFDDIEADFLNKNLIENDTFLFLREHPFYPSTITKEFRNQSNILSFNADHFSEIMDYLPVFKKLITDYSSIYLDYLCLDRPIAFIPYDIKEYSEHTGFTFNYNELTPGIKIFTQEELLSFLIEENDNYKKFRAEISQLINAKPYRNCKENIDLIQEFIL